MLTDVGNYCLCMNTLLVPYQTYLSSVGNLRTHHCEIRQCYEGVIHRSSVVNGKFGVMGGFKRGVLTLG